MWVPDIQTIFLIIAFVNVFLTLLILIFWKTQKTYDGFVIWALSLLFQSCTYLLFMLRGVFPDLITILFANVLAVLAALMRVDAIRRFIWSRPLPVLYYSILFLFTFVFAQFIDSSIVARTFILTLIIAPSLFAGGLLAALFRDRETRVLRSLFAASLIMPGIVMVIRQITWMLVYGEYTLFGTDLPNIAFFLAAIIGDIMATGTFLLLNMVRSEKEVIASEERYRNLADNLPDYIIIHDGKTIRYANPAACRLAGMTPVELEGRSIYMFLTEESSRIIEPLLLQAPMKAQPFSPWEIALKLPGGQVRQCLVKTVPINDRGIPGYISVITDVTEQKAAEESLFWANKKLGILSSITRHDIKNQLLILKSYLALSKMSLDDRNSLLEYISKVDAVANTIDHQLDFTKAYEDMGGTAPVWQNVEVTVRRAVASIPLRGVAVSVDRTDLEVFTDPMLLNVFSNLIDNALRYGGDAMTAIRISSHESDGGLLIVFEDNGVGISPEDKPLLFTRGYGEHTGLGLFLSREILAITGITISETGKPGTGARFEMLVPKGSYRFIAKGSMPGEQA